MVFIFQLNVVVQEQFRFLIGYRVTGFQCALAWSAWVCTGFKRMLYSCKSMQITILGFLEFCRLFFPFLCSYWRCRFSKTNFKIGSIQEVNSAENISYFKHSSFSRVTYKTHSWVSEPVCNSHNNTIYLSSNKVLAKKMLDDGFAVGCDHTLPTVPQFQGRADKIWWLRCTSCFCLWWNW